jgi:hypothetical protein
MHCSPSASCWPLLYRRRQLHRATEAIVEKRPARQLDLFEPSPAWAAIPEPIEQELVELLAQMLEAMICHAGSPTEGADEQDHC